MSTSYGLRVAACRLFLRAAAEPRSEIDRQGLRSLQHSDVDWLWLAEYLGGAGLARPLLGMLNDPELVRAVPAGFRNLILQRGMADALRERVQLDAIARIATVLRDIGARGVLLKGSAFLARCAPPNVARATSDVDVLVNGSRAGRVRNELLARGCEGVPDARPSTFHHLEPIGYRGVSIEIHTQIMPAFWGLPESDMLADARAVPGSDVLFTLSPQGLVLHSVVHLSASFYSFGLKTAWDMLDVLRTEPDFDWSRLLALVSKLRVPRSFWAPVGVLADGLDLPIPSAFREHAPTERGARRVEDIAGQRLFSATDGLFDLDIATKTGLILLLLETWSGRVRYLATNLWWRGSRPGTWWAAVGRACRANLLHQAPRQYARYRRRREERPRSPVQ